jgi:hypothetical protein
VPNRLGITLQNCGYGGFVGVRHGVGGPIVVVGV